MYKWNIFSVSLQITWMRWFFTIFNTYCCMKKLDLYFILVDKICAFQYFKRYSVTSCFYWLCCRQLSPAFLRLTFIRLRESFVFPNAVLIKLAEKLVSMFIFQGSFQFRVMQSFLIDFRINIAFLIRVIGNCCRDNQRVKAV